MPSRAPLRRRGSILFSLLLLLFVVGVVPLLWTSYTLVSRSKEILVLDQNSMQLDKARSLSQQIAVYVESLRSHLTAVARTLEVEATAMRFADRIARMRDAKALERYVGGDSRIYYFSIADAMFAPVVLRVRSYGLPLSGLAARYQETMLADEHLCEWIRYSSAETVVIPYEEVGAGA